MNLPLAIRIALLLSFTLLASTSRATTTAFDDKTSFDAAAAGLSGSQTVDFDSVASGTIFASGSGTGGLSFDYAIADQSIEVSSTFGTTSGSNYLGLDNPDTAFYLGDSFTIQFNRTVHAVGLYLITGSDAQAGDLELATSGGSVFNSSSFVPVSDGQAYYLGLIESDPALGFTSATVTGITSGDAFLAFSADDITSAGGVAVVPVVPEPASAALLFAGLALMGVFTRRRMR
jgi:PEP-CTERM motif